jgi:peptidoglycan/LPS O-acetylase OafA/YrhL
MAALGVFVFHSSRLAPVPFLHLLAPAGDAGVAFFFILSGFVLAWSFSPTVPTRIFYWRRFARVWPMLAATTAMSFILLSQSWHVVGNRLLLSLGLLQAWFPAGAVFGNPVAWTLSCEAFFYLAFPLLVRPIRGMRGRNLVIVMALLFLLEWAFRMWAWKLLGPLEKPQSLMLARLPIYRLVEFLLGVTAAVALQHGWRPPLGVRASMVALAACALTVRHGIGSDWWSGGWYNQALAPAMVLLIAATAARDVEGSPSIWRRRWLIALGESSYAFYLIHLLVIWKLPDLAADRHVSWLNLVAVLTWLVIAIIMSSGCYRLVEHPIEQWLRALAPTHKPPHRPSKRTQVPTKGDVPRRERDGFVVN